MTLHPLENPGYVDAGYLELLARTMAELKTLSYDRMRAAPGMRVLDVGCGPATDTLALAERVGPAGSVAGVDYDAEMVAEAERRAAAAGVAERVSHRVGAAQALPFGDGEFDAARCERLFQHLPDPDAAAREMARVVRPGGRVVAVDTDFGTLSIDSANPGRERRVVEALARDSLLNGYSGRRLFGQLRRAGLEEAGGGDPVRDPLLRLRAHRPAPGADRARPAARRRRGGDGVVAGGDAGGGRGGLVLRQRQRRRGVRDEGGAMTPLRIVILRNPDLGDGFFREVLAMRIAGFLHHHAEANVAPDRYESVSTHVVVCTEERGGLRPRMGFRSTSARECAAAGLPFPLTAAIASVGGAEHAAALARELDACRRAGRDASYLGLWTTDPALRRDRRLFRRVLHTVGAMMVGLVEDEGAGHLLAAGLPRLGTDRFLSGYGMRRMTHDGAELPAFPVPHIPGATAVMMRLETFSATALAEAAAGRADWDRRLVVSPRARALAA